MQAGSLKKIHNEHVILIAVLLLALVNGLLYILIVPPWQHYDEPNHFEYVWLLVERGERPKPGDYDTGMRRDVARSMIEHGFYQGWGQPPDLTSEKPWIGQFSQLDEPPLYYLLVSLPQRLLPIEDVTFQLYAARLVSLALFLVTILAGYGLAAEITPARHPLRFLVPLTMALLPAFVDLMTAVNNDVGAIAAFSLFLWGCVRLVRRGPSWPTLLWVLAACALCLFTKRTVYLALPLLGIALLFAFLRGKYRVLAWGAVALSGIALVLAIFSWGDAALWYRDTSQNFATRAALPETPEGQLAFRLSIQPGDPPAKLVQILPTDIARDMSAQPYTLGAWIWASQPVEINSAQVKVFDDKQVFAEKILVTETPQFFALAFSPQGNTQRTWILLQPSKSLNIENPIEIYYDGVVLAEGKFPVDQVPKIDKDGSSGTWGGAPFENLLRNGSAENSWFYLRPWVDTILSQFFSDYEGQESFSFFLNGVQPDRFTGDSRILSGCTDQFAPHLLGQIRMGTRGAGGWETLRLDPAPTDLVGRCRCRADLLAASGSTEETSLGCAVPFRPDHALILGPNTGARFYLPAHADICTCGSLHLSSHHSNRVVLEYRLAYAPGSASALAAPARMGEIRCLCRFLLIVEPVRLAEHCPFLWVSELTPGMQRCIILMWFFDNLCGFLLRSYVECTKSDAC